MQERNVNEMLFVQTSDSSLMGLKPNSIYVYGQYICSKKELPEILKYITKIVREKNNEEENKKLGALLRKKFGE